MERMVAVMERMMNQYEGPRGCEHFTAFKNAEPPTFQGSHDPMVAINWIRHIERVYTVVEYNEEQKVRYASYMLKRDAESCWLNAQRAMGGEASWDRFKELFYKKYIPNAVRNAKDIEFMKLEQGDMTVAAYCSSLYFQV